MKAEGPTKNIWSILCPSYHGATLLSLILGNHSKVAALGDTVPTTAFNHMCGCGRYVSECDFWRGLAAKIPYRGREHLFFTRPQMLDRSRWMRFGAWPLLCSGVRLGLKYRIEPFATSVELLAGGACQAKNAEIFVDGFKDITRYLSARLSGLPVEGAIHLVRDPRAFAASCTRIKKRNISVQDAANLWVKLHGRLEMTKKVTGGQWVMLRYEDFVRNPDKVIQNIFAAMGLQGEDVVRPIDPGAHWVGSSSLREFSGQISLEEKWHHELTPEEIVLVEKITASGMQTYGYEPF